ncbi:hypothetical protein HELRODRAFT_192107 [Helobdella robusta]|uniref:Uncharacterized protein n=1 Tax=Helobdella robusta TaxID=6412 RepID=T1FTK7_HELRO|nr:hypothetical protein HELRODRAFT_192107 [Helobdella robusta]ESO03080.1 hypothetical protein HELRODRAFT_192107 [Helobdella robusta]
MSSVTMAADSTQCGDYSRKMTKPNEKVVKKKRKKFNSTPPSSSSSNSSSDSGSGSGGESSSSASDNDCSSSGSSSLSSPSSSSGGRQKRDAKKKSSKTSKGRKRASCESECESDLDLNKELLPIAGYMDDKKQMVDNMFKSISSIKLRTMLPEILKVATVIIICY